MVNGISAEISDRIVQVANDLYEKNDREKFPTVDEVRRAAKVDMNTASSVMREWRKNQISRAAPVAIAIPAGVQEAFQSAIGVAWQEAQTNANEALAAAQKNWDDERAAADEMRQELAESYEDVAGQLDGVTRDLQELQKNYDTLKTQSDDDARRVVEQTQQIQELLARVDASKQQAEERGEQLAEVKGELTKARAEAREDRKDADRERKALEAQHRKEQDKADAAVLELRQRVDVLTGELAQVTAKLDTQQAQAESQAQAAAEAQQECKEAQKNLAQCREDNATLTGELKALREQLADLKQKDSQKTGNKG